jgi:hypothetical protein
MALEPFQTAESYEFPLVRQLSIFLDNRVGQLVRLTRLLDDTEIHILALSVVNAQDCAIIRMIVDDPDEAHTLLSNSQFPVSESEVLVVGVPEGKRALLYIWMAMTSAEINVMYTYPLLVRPHDRPALVVAADNLETAAEILRNKNFDVLNQADLLDGNH